MTLCTTYIPQNRHGHVGCADMIFTDLGVLLSLILGLTGFWGSSYRVLSLLVCQFSIFSFQLAEKVPELRGLCACLRAGTHVLCTGLGQKHEPALLPQRIQEKKRDLCVALLCSMLRSAAAVPETDKR